MHETVLQNFMYLRLSKIPANENLLPWACPDSILLRSIFWARIFSSTPDLACNKRFYSRQNLDEKELETLHHIQHHIQQRNGSRKNYKHSTLFSTMFENIKKSILKPFSTTIHRAIGF